MTANSIDKKTFQVSDNDQFLGELIYENLFYQKAQIKMANSTMYQIKPVGIFQTSIAINQNEAEVAQLVMNWSGEIVISFTDHRAYVMKMNQFYFGKYILENKSQEKILQIEPQFDWRSFHNQKDINYHITENDHAKDPLLLLLCVYATNFFISSASGANAGNL
ncbi:MAG: hypothetical protein WAT92_16740 [Saprospiraceae bacterium]